MTSIVFSTSRPRLDDALMALGPLLLRLWLAQEFLLAAWTKFGAGFAPPEWFSQLHFLPPLNLLPAQFNWLSVMGLEALLGAALLVGLCTRLAALGLAGITVVAIQSVHFDLGWAGWNQLDSDAGQGFKLPLMMLVMLFGLVAGGPGALSLDAWRRKSA